MEFVPQYYHNNEGVSVLFKDGISYLWQIQDKFRGRGGGGDQPSVKHLCESVQLV